MVGSTDDLGEKHDLQYPLKHQEIPQGPENFQRRLKYLTKSQRNPKGIMKPQTVVKGPPKPKVIPKRFLKSVFWIVLKDLLKQKIDSNLFFKFFCPKRTILYFFPQKFIMIENVKCDVKF